MPLSDPFIIPYCLGSFDVKSLPRIGLQTRPDVVSIPKSYMPGIYLFHPEVKRFLLKVRYSERMECMLHVHTRYDAWDDEKLVGNVQ